jgi:hypothetical protein
MRLSSHMDQWTVGVDAECGDSGIVENINVSHLVCPYVNVKKPARGGRVIDGKCEHVRLFVQIEATGIWCRKFLFHLCNLDVATCGHNSTQNPIFRGVAEYLLEFVFLSYVVHGGFPI